MIDQWYEYLALLGFIILLVFVGMGKECADCGAEMDMCGRLRGAGGVHTVTCKYRDEEV